MKTIGDLGTVVAETPLEWLILRSLLQAKVRDSFTCDALTSRGRHVIVSAPVADADAGTYRVDVTLCDGPFIRANPVAWTYSILARLCTRPYGTRDGDPELFVTVPHADTFRPPAGLPCPATGDDLRYLFCDADAATLAALEVAIVKQRQQREQREAAPISPELAALLEEIAL